MTKSNASKTPAAKSAKNAKTTKVTKVETAPATTGKRGGGRKAPVFSDTAKIAQALRFIADGNMNGFTAAGFSQHHIRQLGKGVSGGMFGPGQGLGYVEVVKDESERPEGVKGRRPMVPRLTADGKKRLKELEAQIARKLAKEAAGAAAEKAPAKAKEKVAAKVKETPVETPAPAAETPASEPVPEQTETVAEAGESQAA